jgi:hypothetical protein
MKLALTTAITAIAAFALLFTLKGSEAGVVNPAIHIDMDISDGACTDIDPTATVASGATGYQVAVCFVNNTTDPVAAFGFHVLYDDTLVQAPNACENDFDDPTPPPDCAAPSLNYNPDTNQANQFSTPGLGGGWDCSGGVGAFPQGDLDNQPGNGSGDAYSGGCSSAAGPNTLVSGPLSVITFNVLSNEPAVLTLSQVSVTGDSGVEIASCREPVDVPADCFDGTFNPAEATATPTNTTAPDTETPTATNTTAPDTETPTPTNTTAPDTETPTATNTTAPDTETPTPTNTTAPDTETPTATNTTAPDTETPTPTSTTQPDTETPTATNTTQPDTETPTATNTTQPDTETPTATNTTAPDTATPTNTNTPSPTATTPAGDCEEDVNNDGKVNIKDLVFVAKRLHNDDPAADVDGDGDVDVRDLKLVLRAVLRTLFGGSC